MGRRLVCAKISNPLGASEEAWDARGKRPAARKDPCDASIGRAAATWRSDHPASRHVVPRGRRERDAVFSTRRAPGTSQKLNALKRPQAVVWVASTVSTHRARRGTSAASAPPPPPGWAWACAPGRRAASAAPASADPSSARTCASGAQCASGLLPRRQPTLLHLCSTSQRLFPCCL